MFLVVAQQGARLVEHEITALAVVAEAVIRVVVVGADLPVIAELAAVEQADLREVAERDAAAAAKEAAEAAVASPLLEDVNIAGAQGILVNVTAGLDLSIGELDDVGSTITQLASDDATVVVGTVIDSEMSSGELRVTLVATGLGKDKKQVKETQPEVPVIKPERTGKIDYSKLDAPIGMRGSKKIVGDSIEIPEMTDKESMEYLEIPAFLRRQAD